MTDGSKDDVVHQVDASTDFAWQALHIGERQEARSAFETSIELLRGLPLSARTLVHAVRMVRALDGLAATWMDEDAQAAVQYLEASLRMLGSLPAEVATAGTPQLVGRLAVALELSGRRHEANIRYQEALRGLRIGDPMSPALAEVLANFGDFLRDEGQLGEARLMLEEATDILMNLGEGYLRHLGSVRHKLGRTFADLHDYTAARNEFELALTIDRQLHNQEGIRTCLASLARLHIDEGRPDEAVAEYASNTANLDQLNLEGRHTGELMGHGEAYWATKQYQEARRCWEAAEQLLRNEGRIGEDLAITLHNLGHVAVIQRDPSAVRLYAESEKIFHETTHLGYRSVEVLASLAGIRLIGANVDSAIALASRAVEIAESTRSRAGGTDSRRRAFVELENAYRCLIEALHERNAPGDRALAFRTTEQMKARVLLEDLTSRFNVSSHDDDVARAGRARERELHHKRAEISSRLRRLAPHDSSPAYSAAISERLAIDRELNRLATGDDGYRNTVPAPVVSVAETQELLTPGTLLLEYSVGYSHDSAIATGGDHVYLWAITKTEFFSSRLDITGSVLDHMVRAVMDSLLRRDSSPSDLEAGSTSHRSQDGDKQWGDLSQALLGLVPSGMWHQAERLIIVPEGVLSYLPFDLLEREDGTILLEGFAVSSAPSVSLLRTIRANWTPRPIWDPEFLGFGNPALPRNVSVGSRLRGRHSWGQVSATPLPGSAEEVESIAAMFGPRGRAYVEADATELRVMSEGPGARYLHFATHGLMDDEDALYSGLLLAPASSEGLTERFDEILEAHEISALRLSAELVVCSACQTGLGRMWAGEGIVGLSHAFLLAGCRSLIVSLWSVPDIPTAELMKALYAAILRGASIADALRVAKEIVRRRWPHPLNWAAFQYIGPG